ncbi:MAG: methyltransferase domain-containing protein [Patescibacteria group bacterium]
MRILINRLKNIFYYWFGVGIFILNKLRYGVQGYVRPRPFSASDFEKAIEYDISVVNHWMNYIKKYTLNQASLKNKVVLELGPGADLGTGFALLAKGIAHYYAIDVNNLAANTPISFYTMMLDRISHSQDFRDIDKGKLTEQIEQMRKGQQGLIKYVCRKDFDISIFGKASIDYILSQAAFEHFHDVPHVMKQLSEVARTGAILLAEIDLQTHTGVLRKRDPLNIYRYSHFLYQLLYFTGIPNRVRPYEYKELLQQNGWKNITVYPLNQLAKAQYQKVVRSLHTRFQSSQSEMQYLSIIICATKG